MVRLYYSTSEVAEILDVNVSLIRFYEKKFNLKFKRNGKERQITEHDIEKLREIINTAGKGSLTLKGVKQKLSNKSDENKNKNALVNKLLTIRAFLKETLDEIN
ncbi:regulatory protein MerR [Emticicia oligotrophica DSM 17448]|uniref:Regulatory protein MerR n=1 Tax=Emticicia oligotrophica (strain DSM 17448 / CIP 109782 / MTCC 6937 / GPTSA100-15) TaxID=929562 RepID=A0ABN4AR37_EMTOG|nr:MULTISPECIES: MerR family transcriptional regulator [Emticicia]AFK04980.1 regulatory protein MerR [Emticicia oligotrophica DSM 17448]